MNNQSTQAHSAQNPKPQTLLPADQSVIELPLTVAYFFVAIDEQRDGYKLLCAPVSQNFKTAEEALDFCDRCGIEGAYCLSAGLFVRSIAEAEEIERAIFPEQKNPAN